MRNRQQHPAKQQRAGRRSLGLTTPGLLSAALLTASFLSAPVSASTIVQFRTFHQNHVVSEGYANDLDKVFADIGEAKASAAVAPTERHYFHYHDIQITDVGSSVYSDTDGDGYFTHFSVSFDVDTDYADTRVYAKLYLRTDDSDYTLFHTSEEFEIYNNLSSDSYKLDSKLVANYAAAYYDIRIEIYESHSDALYDTVDASTHRTLYALPLESDLLDGGPPDSIVHEHIGSMTFAGLMVLGLFAHRRRRNPIKH